MIDFRYHIVSLISVFLALAVGIALGAGPLKETIGDTLTGQVEQLRTEKDQLRADLDEALVQNQDADAWIDAAGTELLAGSLTDRRVAVIALGEVPEPVRNGLDARLEQAGATVSAHATLTPAWTDAELRSFRQALLGNLVQYLDPVPADDAAAQTALAEALVQGLVSANPQEPNVLTEQASILLELLSSGDSPLVTFTDPVEAPADAVIVLGVPLDPAATADEPSPEPTEEVVASQLAIVTAAQERSEGAVLLDGPRGVDSLVDAVLADGDLSELLSTVSDSEETAGQVSAPLALAARIAGTVGHYGSGDGETPVPPSVDLMPVDRTAQPPDLEGSSSGADGGESQDGADG